MNWHYYNHAMIPDCAPHEKIDMSCLEDGSIWKYRKSTFFVRWTTDFDCGYETNWWYIIKDQPFDISFLKAKRRYEINKGKRYFDIKLIDPSKYREKLYDVQVAAFSAYPEKYRPTVNKEQFFNSINNWDKYIVYGAFHKETGELCGYSLLKKINDLCIDFSVQKTNPEFERYAINAALIAKILDDHNEFLSNGGYICDGTRSVNHETKFQDYLEKYFDFRKAYCKLHIEYNLKIKWIIYFLYPFRFLLNKFDNFGVVHQLNAVLKMEEIVRGK